MLVAMTHPAHVKRARATRHHQVGQCLGAVVVIAARARKHGSERHHIALHDDERDGSVTPVLGGKLVVDKVANLESVVANITDGSFTHADLSVTNSFTISNATNNAVLFAKAGGVIDFVSGSSGKVLQIASNNTPTFNDLDGGSF